MTAEEKSNQKSAKPGGREDPADVKKEKLKGRKLEHVSDDVSKKLSQMRRQSEEQAAASYANKLGLAYLDLNIFPVDYESVVLIDEEAAKKHKLVVVFKREKDVKVVTTEPENDNAIEFLKNWSSEKGYTVALHVVSEASFSRALESYRRGSLTETFDYLRMNMSGAELDSFQSELKDLMDLKKRIMELPVTQTLNIIFAGSIKMRSSDVHFEPQADETVRLRYRIDGVLQDVADFPITYYPTILSRIKVLSKMRVNIRDVAQDGRFSVRFDEKKEIDVRVSVLPGNHGENIVVRILNQDITELTIEKTGVRGLNHERLVKESAKKQGMIINSGPTGSGKTTTLYALINRINSPDKKVISIEDPIEYQVPGVSQTQVEAEKGYTFESGLRSIVRQDPDVILVGEIRDAETAEIAIHAALTGHLVLSTIHSNSSAGVVGRLVDLGVKPALITNAINAFIAQRLLRKLCSHCKEEYEPAAETVDTIKKMLSLISPKSKIDIPKEIKHLWRPKGCPKCQGIGYLGRIGIFEVMTISDEIRTMINDMATADDLRAAALENGMITYEQDGIIKAIEGETSLEELQRVTGKGEYLMELYDKIVIQSLSRGILVDKEAMEKMKGLKTDYDKMEKELRDASMKEVIKYIFAAGLYMRAGDIHIEPGETHFKIRFRIDGILHDIVKLPMTEFLNVLNEVKNLSGFKTQSRQGVVDGRFRIIIPEDVPDIDDNKIDVRVSIILGGFGDIIVMRLLNSAAAATDLSSLNLHPLNLRKLKKNIKKPNGIVFNTGPTGSGKTTTLYSALAHINKPELKIITVEDPIEYQMDGIIQTQVSEKEEYTFATAIRALMRQNPDIIMVGEVRDEETAQTAYQAALTGHLVLSTIHTNNAAGSVQRLSNMGVRLSDLASGTNCFIAQRLVRKLCPHCRKEIKPTEAQKIEIEEEFTSISPKTKVVAPELSSIFQAVGCPKCNNLGYHGRTPIAEILEVDPEMEKFIVTNPTTNELHKKAIEEGMLSMAQNGMLRVLEGITTFEEIARISRDVGSGEEETEEKSPEGGSPSGRKEAPTSPTDSAKASMVKKAS